MIANFLKHNWGWIILFIILVSTCNRYKEESDTAYLNNTTLLDSIRYYKLKSGSLVASKTVIEYDSKQLKSLVRESNKTVKEITEKFNKVEVIVQTITKTKIDSIKVVYKDTLNSHYKRFGSKIEPHYSFDYESDSKGFQLTNFQLADDSITYVKGIKKKWLFGKKTTVLDIHHSNPLVKDYTIEVINLKEPKQWYETTVFKVGVGVLGGMIIMEQIND